MYSVKSHMLKSSMTWLNSYRTSILNGDLKVVYRPYFPKDNADYFNAVYVGLVDKNGHVIDHHILHKSDLQTLVNWFNNTPIPA